MLSFTAWEVESDEKTSLLVSPFKEIILNQNAKHHERSNGG